MDPIPPKKPKDLPFYVAPDHVRTSARIISDAKSSLVRTNLRSIQTKRPVTPQESQRKLFGEQSVRDPQARPPSAFSLGARNFDSESRPVSGTRLLPLEHKPKIQPDAEVLIAPKPPTDPNRPLSGTKRPSSRQRVSLQHSASVDSSLSLSGDDQQSRPRSGSLHEGLHGEKAHSRETTQDSQPRRVRSGPKERTKPIQEKEFQNKSKDATTSSEPQRSETKRASSGQRRETKEENANLRSSQSSSKPGSAGRREEESPEESAYYNQNILPLLDKMACQLKEKDTDVLISLSEELYEALEEGRLLGKNCKRRSAILKTLFKLLDLESPQLLLKLATLILALKVSGNNLINICKLVFKVSREEKHDKFFMQGNIVGLLLETLDTTDFTAYDSLVYCIGSLKFLSGNSTTLKFMVKRNALKYLTRLLIAINKHNTESSKPSEQLGHVLVQLTATLRNMADVSGLRIQFLELEVMEELCKVMEMYSTDADLILNISRIFSKLTMHTDCCNALSKNPSHFKSFLHLLKIYQRREDLIVRLGFILGNLTSKNNQARINLTDHPKAVDIILNVFRYYVELDNKAAEEKKTDEPSASKTEDVMVKLVRLIANLSISEEVGPTIACNDLCVTLALQILDTKSIESNEELVINTAATLNNLSFYNIKESAVTVQQLVVTKSLMKLLNINNIDGLTEATRVFGNLSREKAVRDFMVIHKVDEMMVLLLDSQQQETVYAACGVLINLMVDEEKRPTLQRLGGIRKLIDVLKDFARQDWHLGSLVCQTLWNYSSKIVSSNAAFGEEQTQELVELLTEYLDEEAALDEALTPNYDEEMQEYIQQIWESEFCPAASDLLKRIELHASKFELLKNPNM